MAHHVNSSGRTVANPSEELEPDDSVVWLLKTNQEDFIDETTREKPFDKGGTKIFRPKLITRRIAVQAGVFTVHRLSDDDTFVTRKSDACNSGG